MDSQRFDALTRTLRSRRTALGGLLSAGLTALLGLPAPDEAAAHTFLAACRKIKVKRRRTRCMRRARRHNARHRATNCTGVVCPPVANGTTACQRGVCIITSCASGFGNCNGRVADGCEATVRTDAANCGKCGIACPGFASDRCVNGSCMQVFATVGAFIYTVPARGTLRLDITGGQGEPGGAGTSAIAREVWVATVVSAGAPPPFLPWPRARSSTSTSVARAGLGRTVPTTSAVTAALPDRVAVAPTQVAREVLAEPLLLGAGAGAVAGLPPMCVGLPSCPLTASWWPRGAAGVAVGRVGPSSLAVKALAALGVEAVGAAAPVVMAGWLPAVKAATAAPREAIAS